MTLLTGLKRCLTVNSVLKVCGCITLFQFLNGIISPPYAVSEKGLEKSGSSYVRRYLYFDFTIKMAHVIITCFMLSTVFELPSPTLVTSDVTETLSWSSPSPHWVVLWIISTLVVLLVETSLLEPVLSMHRHDVSPLLQWYTLAWRAVDLMAGVAAWVYYQRVVRSRGGTRAEVEWND